MRRVRLLLALTGLGALMVGAPVCALEAGAVKDAPQVSTRSDRALNLLDAAARAARTRTWSGTQYVATNRAGTVTSSVLQVTHVAGQGRTVRALAGSDGSQSQAVTADVLDATLLGLLASHYDLVVAGQSRYAGHRAHVVEARRPGVAGTAGVAGRFWVGTRSGLVLRRDVFDEAGQVVRTSAFVEMTVSPAAPRRTLAASYALEQAVRPGGQRLDSAALSGLEDDGWPVVRTLPGGLELFDARLHDDGAGVLHLTYSDGLSTLSLFVQPGEAPMLEGASSRSVGGGRVWEDHGVPARVVWSGEGRTWTLVSDAPEGTVDAAVEALPHGAAPARDDGVLPRTWRGMSRVGSWLNPFD